MATVWEATDNYAFGTLKFAVNPTSTQITFNTGEGNNFNATLENRVVLFGQGYSNPSDDPNREIVRITQNAGDVYDITDGVPAGRGLEDTIAGTFVVNDKVAVVMTQVTIDAIHDAVNTAENDIDTNTTNIGTNATDIGTNTTDIGTNTTNIGTNTTNISTNADDISDLVDGTTPAGDSTKVGGHTPTSTPTANAIPISQATAKPLALGWMNLEYSVYQLTATSGTAPASSSGVTSRNPRLLNNSVHEGITGVSISGGRFVLPEGVYYISAWSAVGHNCLGVRTVIRNITDASDTMFGLSGYYGNSNAYNHMHVSGKITVATTKSFEIQTYCEAGSIPMGSRVNEAGVSEIYAQVDIFALNQ